MFNLTYRFYEKQTNKQKNISNVILGTGQGAAQRKSFSGYRKEERLDSFKHNRLSLLRFGSGSVSSQGAFFNLMNVYVSLHSPAGLIVRQLASVTAFNSSQNMIISNRDRKLETI